MNVRTVAMKATLIDGMVNIDSDDLAYANIDNMYKTESGNGFGIQINDESIREQATSLCHEITDRLRQLNNLTHQSPCGQSMREHK